MINKDDLIAALQQLTPEQLQGILSQGHGRSPIRADRQLKDLTRPPTAMDPRPLFRSDVYPEFHVTQSEYPKLLWHIETGQEVTVWNADEEQSKGAMWASRPPMFQPLSPEERARQMFEELSDEDQQFIREQQRQMKLQKVNAAFGVLTETQATGAMGEQPVKRGRKKDLVGA